MWLRHGFHNDTGSTPYIAVEVVVNAGELQMIGRDTSAYINDAAWRKKFRVKDLVFMHLHIDL